MWECHGTGHGHPGRTARPLDRDWSGRVEVVEEVMKAIALYSQWFQGLNRDTLVPDVVVTGLHWEGEWQDVNCIVLFTCDLYGQGPPFRRDFIVEFHVPIHVTPVTCHNTSIRSDTALRSTAPSCGLRHPALRTSLGDPIEVGAIRKAQGGMGQAVSIEVMG